MKIHTNTITRQDLIKAAPADLNLEITSHGSRKRDHAFNVGIGALHGADSHGITRAYARNTGQYGGGGNYDRAATWIEWGDWITALFKIDPDAIIGHYNGAADFIKQTTNYAPHRPKRESAEKHARRWRRELEA